MTRFLTFTALALLPALPARADFAPGDFVRVTRSEMLTFEGKGFVGAPKGQEFTILKHEPAQKRILIPYLKDDGTLIAVAFPDDAIEPAPDNSLRDLARAMESFRDQRHADAKRLLLRASQDKQLAALVPPLIRRLDTAYAGATQARAGTAAGRQAFAAALQGLRDTAEQLEQVGYITYALHLDEGADRLGGAASVTKLDRTALAKRAAISQTALMRARQCVALKKLNAAAKAIGEGLQAEPAQLELQALQPRVLRDIDDAEALYVTANKMRRFEGGVIHALSAIDDGIKLCADHEKLKSLRKELTAAFEERTSPRVTPAFLTAARTQSSAQSLEEGRRLYTNRCTECHDLEMLDSRTLTAWNSTVTGMSRRANLSAEEKARILEYIAAAQKVVESSGSR